MSENINFEIKKRDDLLKEIRESNEIVSDFEIEKEASRFCGRDAKEIFIRACKWYREQLKFKQPKKD